MNQFVQRVVSYVVNEVIITGLANSKLFQRFAVSTDASLKKYTETLNKTLEQLAQQETSTASRPVLPRTGFTRFVSAFAKEIRKDLGMGH